MKKSIYVILLFAISYETAIPTTLSNPPSPSTLNYLYLPMKKNHKFGDDICYYREMDEKLNYYIFYVKPCEKGKYCQPEIDNGQPFGYCVDIQTNTTTISNWNEPCDSDMECQYGLTCENTCTITSCSQNEKKYQHNIFNFQCHSTYFQVESKYCKYTDIKYDNNNYYDSLNSVLYEGNYPGLPSECGKINYRSVEYPYNSGSGTERDTMYIEESREWCTIGSVPDNEFVSDAKYCNSGFTLTFYPNKQLTEPSKHYTHTLKQMCVTPIEIDVNNPFAPGGCIITYKIGEQGPKKYNSNKGTASSCSQSVIIESERYREFANAFNQATDEDKKNCFDIDTYKYSCKNVNLIKLWYFKKHPEDYLFYKDRKKLEKVLDYKIQREYPTYSEFSQYLNYSYLLFLLILIIM